MKRIVCLLLTVVICSVTIGLGAAAEQDAPPSMEACVTAWNHAPVGTYKGASGCAAFVRFAFIKMYGHTEQLKKNVCVVKTGCKGSGLLKAVLYDAGAALPGDAVRITKTGFAGIETRTTHIFLVSELTDTQCVSYDAGFHKGKNLANYANKYQKSYAKLLKDIGISETDTYVIKIIHAAENQDAICPSGADLSDSGFSMAGSSVAASGGGSPGTSSGSPSAAGSLALYLAYFQSNFQTNTSQVYLFDVTHDGIPELMVLSQNGVSEFLSPMDDVTFEVFTDLDGTVRQIFQISGSTSHAAGWITVGIFQEDGLDYLFVRQDQMWQGIGLLSHNIFSLQNDGTQASYLHDELNWDGSDAVPSDLYDAYCQRAEIDQKKCLILLDTINASYYLPSGWEDAADAKMSGGADAAGQLKKYLSDELVARYGAADLAAVKRAYTDLDVYDGGVMGVLQEDCRGVLCAALADLNGDARPELIAILGEGDSASNTNAILRVFQYSGTAIQQLPGSGIRIQQIYNSFLGMGNTFSVHTFTCQYGVGLYTHAQSGGGDGGKMRDAFYIVDGGQLTPWIVFTRERHTDEPQAVSFEVTTPWMHKSGWQDSFFLSEQEVAAKLFASANGSISPLLLPPWTDHTDMICR